MKSSNTISVSTANLGFSPRRGGGVRAPAAGILAHVPDILAEWFSDARAFLIPAEHLGPRGLSDAYASALRQARGVDEHRVALLGDALGLHARRSADLYARAPGSWLPPRAANLLVIDDPDGVSPYAVPFHNTVWVLYASDLDPARSHVEWIVWQLVHFERLALLGDVREATLADLGYWLDRSAAECEAFALAAERATRPDAEASRTLARALPAMHGWHHLTLRPPPESLTAPLVRVEGTELLVPREAAPLLRAIVQAFETSAHQAHERYVTRVSPTASPTAEHPAAALYRWVRDAAPRVLVVDEDGAAVWSPHAPERAAALRRALDHLHPYAAESLRADLARIDERTRDVFDRLRDPDDLPRDCSVVDETGGVYLVARERLIAYALRQPAFDPVREPSPPFHRALVGARVAHEYGHLLHEAGWIRVAPARKGDYEAATRALAEGLDAAVRAIPSRLADALSEELDAARVGLDDVGHALAHATLVRLEDFAANLFARHVLRPDELDAYVRNNVRHHMDEPLGPIAHLMRQSVEAQYLPLVGVVDPFAHVLATTWFGDYFIRSGVFSEQSVRDVFNAVAAACATFELDPRRIDVTSRTH